jgi:polyhydroxyalkanoate synthesis regulator phasin
MTIEQTPEETTPVDAASPTDAPEAAAASADAGTERAFAENLKKLALAATSAVKVSQDDVKSLVTKLVEKGELAQQDARKIVTDVGDWVKKTATDPVGRAREAAGQLFKGREEEAAEQGEATGEQLAERIQGSIERVLRAMHIASRSDLDDLKSSIEKLDEKLDELLKTRGLEAASA